MAEKTYIAIDLKSFYASVECRERGLDPLRTHLVVADESRTQKTICLAVTPSLKAQGISGRPRLFEVVQRVKDINAMRQAQLPGHSFSGTSYDAVALQRDASLALEYIVAPPRMAYYMKYSTEIYEIYLKYFSPDDMVVYSIDEVFIDVTHYLSLYGVSPHDLAMRVIQDVLQTTGITATAGIGPNLFLCKIALDIMAKRIPPDRDGVRIAQLDEQLYRRVLWSHRPLTDFWRVGRGYAKKLEGHGLYTMGDIARCSIGDASAYYNEELLYKLFGINAELLIDHAWGWEPCTIADIKAYKPSNNCLCSGQVLQRPYTAEEARVVVLEMTDLLVLDLVDKGLVTDQLVLTVGYDIENLQDPMRRRMYKGPIKTDAYGRRVPKSAHGTTNLKQPSSSTKQITEAVMALYDRIMDKNLLVRRVNMSANHVVPENSVTKKSTEQLTLFTDYDKLEQVRQEEEAALEREKRVQKTLLTIKKKYGKNAIIKGVDLQEAATLRDRNEQIGGHKA